LPDATTARANASGDIAGTRKAGVGSASGVGEKRRQNAIGFVLSSSVPEPGICMSCNIESTSNFSAASAENAATVLWIAAPRRSSDGAWT
jgi:hypothetical protein